MDEKFGNMTMGEALEKIEQGGEESLALLKRIEGNTRSSALTHKEAKQTAPKAAAQAATNIKIALPSEAVKVSPPPVKIATAHRDESGKLVTLSEEEKSAHANGKTLTEILKGGASKTWSEKKGSVKDFAGRAALGPLWDVGKEIKEAFGSARDKSDQGTTGELKQWAGNTWAAKKMETAKAWAGKKLDNVKAWTGNTVIAKKLQKSMEDLTKTFKEGRALDKKQGSRTAPGVSPTVVQSQKEGGMLENILGGKMLKDMLPKKVTGFLSKIPVLGKLFPAAAEGVAGATGAAGGGLLSKIPGAGMLGKIGGKIPFIGGAITAGMTLATGGSKTEAAGAGLGSVAGGALGSLAGPLGTVAGSIAGAWIGQKLGGLFNSQNKSEKEQNKIQADLLSQQGSQQENFFSRLGGVFDKAKTVVQDKTSGAQQGWSESRANGGNIWTSGVAAIKGAVKGVSGITKERYLAQKANIAEAAKATGMDQDTLTQIAGVESNFKADAKAGKKSSAAGLYQFTDGTWKAQLEKNGAKHGLGAGTSKFDPRANALLGAEYAKENALTLNRSGYGADSANLYMAHFLGAGSKKGGAGAIGFLDKMQQNPDTVPALDPKFAAAAAANKNIFYDASGNAKSYKGIYSGFQDKMSRFSMANLEGVTPAPAKAEVAPTTSTPSPSVRYAQAISSGPVSGPGQARAAAQSTGAAVAPVMATALGTPHYKIPPPVQPFIPEPPKAQGMDELLAAIQQLSQQVQTLQQSQQQNRNQNKSENDRVAVIPDIPTEFSDTMLTLMAYDRV